MALPLCAIFFFSGAAGVLFETLWFRVTGLTLGNSFWASNIVLASFMAGLAAGNAMAARYGERLRRPLQLYAFIEGVVALTAERTTKAFSPRPAPSPRAGAVRPQLLFATNISGW